MALARKSKVSSETATTSTQEEVTEVTKKKDEEESVLRKVSSWFHKPSSFDTLKGVKDVPGNAFAIKDLIALRRYGLDAFTKKIEKYNSRVIRYYTGEEQIVLCDWRSAQDFFDKAKVMREAKFPAVTVNTAISDGYLSASLSNGINHVTKKSFLVSISKRVDQEFLFADALQLIPQHIKSWTVVPGVGEEIDLETSVFLLIDDIISESFFGAWLDFDALQTWRAAIFKKPRSRATYQKDALDAFDFLYNTIVHCPKIKEILVEGRSAGLSYDETIKEIFSAATLNSIALSYAMISLIGRLTQTSKADLAKLRDEVKAEVKDGLTIENLQRLKQVEYFVLEVLRMHPPVPVLHGRVRYDFVAESASCLYKVRKNESLACSLYQVQRDPQLYKNPSQFDPDRFELAGAKEHLVVFGGQFNSCPTSKTHQCSGQEICMTVLKIALVYLMFCKIKLKENPKWNCKKHSRLGRPNNVLDLEIFMYREPPFKCQHIMEVIDWDDDAFQQNTVDHEDHE